MAANTAPQQKPDRRPAHACAAERDWAGYFDAVAGKPARETLLLALGRFAEEGRGPTAGMREEERPLAIDLGCGEGRDTAELLRRGWRVLATDGEADALARVRARGDLGAGAGRLELRVQALEAAALPRARLVNASFVLPFCRPDRFAGLWAAIVGAIEPGGRFAGQFFGDRDGWAGLADRTHHSRAAVTALLETWEVEHFVEEEKDAAGAPEYPKHWHVFHVVARRARAPGGGAE